MAVSAVAGLAAGIGAAAANLDFLVLPLDHSEPLLVILL